MSFSPLEISFGVEKLKLIIISSSLVVVFRVNGDAVEGIADRNVKIREVVGEGKSVSWGGAQTKVEGRECKLTNMMFCKVIC